MREGPCSNRPRVRHARAGSTVPPQEIGRPWQSRCGLVHRPIPVWDGHLWVNFLKLALELSEEDAMPRAKCRSEVGWAWGNRRSPAVNLDEVVVARKIASAEEDARALLQLDESSNERVALSRLSHVGDALSNVQSSTAPRPSRELVHSKLLESGQGARAYTGYRQHVVN